MSKSNKLGKLILFGAVAGIAAYGTYYVMNKKKQEAEAEPVEGAEPKKRSYVSINFDGAKEAASGAYEKVKEGIHKVESKIEESGVFKRSSADRGVQDAVSEALDSDVEPVDEELAEDFDQDLKEVKEATEEFFDEPDAK